MFDDHSRQLMERLPRLPDLDHATCRRILSRAYLIVVDARVRAEPGTALVAEAHEVRGMLLCMANALESVAVFDPLNGVQVDPTTQEASAFVAAEALSLVADLGSHDATDVTIGDPIMAGKT